MSTHKVMSRVLELRMHRQTHTSLHGKLSMHTPMHMQACSAGRLPLPLKKLRFTIRLLYNATFVSYAHLIAGTSEGGTYSAPGGGNFLRSGPSADCCSPLPAVLCRLPFARSPSPALASPVALALACRIDPIHVAAYKEGVPVHPHITHRRTMLRSCREQTPPQTSAPHTTASASNTGHNVLVPDSELGAGHGEDGLAIARERKERGTQDIRVVFRNTPPGPSLAGDQSVEWVAPSAAGTPSSALAGPDRATFNSNRELRSAPPSAGAAHVADSSTASVQCICPRTSTGNTLSPSAFLTKP